MDFYTTEQVHTRRHVSFRMFAILFAGALILVGIFGAVRFTDFTTGMTTTEEEPEMQMGIPVVSVDELPLEEVPTYVQRATESVDCDVAYCTAARFPSFMNFGIYEDPEDSNMLWVHGYTTLYTYNLSTGAVVEYTDEVNTQGVTLTSIGRVGDELFVGTQEGLIIYDLTTKTRKHYTTDDGLPSNSNIEVHVDPYDDRVVWIQTFTGLARYTRATGVLKTVIEGEGVQPAVFLVGQKYVWANVGANAYTTGSIRRVNKDTLTVEMWTIYDFTKGDTVQTRLDADAYAAGGVLFVYEDRMLYQFAPSTESWVAVRAFTSTAPLDDILYYANDEVHILTGEYVVGISLTSGEETFRADIPKVGTDAYPLFLHVLHSTDEHTPRYALGSKSTSAQPLYRYNHQTHTFTKVTDFASLFAYHAYSDVRLIDARDTELLFEMGGALHVYDMASGVGHTFATPPGNAHTGAIRDDIYVVHAAEYCDGMGCSHDSGEYVGRTNIFDRETRELLYDASFTDASGGGLKLVVGEYADEVYFIAPEQSTAAVKVLQLDPVLKRSIPSSRMQLKHVPDTGVTRIENNVAGETFTVGESIVSYESQATGPTFVVTLEELGAEERLRVDLPVAPNPEFTAGYPRYDVKDVSVEGSMVYFATDYGLVVLDIEEKTLKVLTTKEGLFSNSLGEMFLLPEYLVLTHGEYTAKDTVMYRRPE